MSALSIRIGRGARSRLPAEIALALIPSLPRRQLERLVQSLIDRMDEADGDPDCEPEETDHTGAEDEPCAIVGKHGPGCPFSDPGGMQDEDDHNTGEPVLAIHGTRYDGPGCPIADLDTSRQIGDGA